jgi:hypothetical protein
MVLNEGYPCPEPRGSGSTDEPRGSGADHYQVIAWRRCRVHPVEGADIIQKSQVLLGLRLKLREGLHRWLLNVRVGSTVLQHRDDTRVFLLSKKARISGLFSFSGAA